MAGNDPRPRSRELHEAAWPDMFANLQTAYAELHGGTVHADSPGEGQGATLTVRLPFMRAGEAPTLTSLREAEAQLHLAKPVDPVELAEAVASLARRAEGSSPRDVDLDIRGTWFT